MSTALLACVAQATAHSPHSTYQPYVEGAAAGHCPGCMQPDLPG